MATDAVNLNPHYRSDARHPDAASSEFVAACYTLALLVPVVGFWMGFALLFKHREGHGAVVMVIGFFAFFVWVGVYLSWFITNLSDASFTFD